jgi:hypothetical protein
MSEPLEILAQGTPNPNAARFTLNRTVATTGTTYRDVTRADVSWARDLLTIPGVTQVFALNDFISVNKTAEADWTVIGPQVEQILRRALS